MGVSSSGVITMLNYLKNCVGTSPQCPNRAHQDDVYGHFVFFANVPSIRALNFCLLGQHIAQGPFPAILLYFPYRSET